MERNIRLSEKLLLFGLSLILLFMIFHDFVPLGSLNDVQAVLNDRSLNELIILTIIGAGQILLIMIGVILFMGKKYPLLIKLWLIIHQTCIFVGALIDWWIPYFFGIGAEQRIERYEEIFGNTHSFLPVMNGIVPNTLHTLFHITLFVCIILTIYICITNDKKLK